MADACSNPSTEEEVLEMLLKNFNRHYKTNKAPFGIFYHSAWFNTGECRFDTAGAKADFSEFNFLLFFLLIYHSLESSSSSTRFHEVHR